MLNKCLTVLKSKVHHLINVRFLVHLDLFEMQIKVYIDTIVSYFTGTVKEIMPLFHCIHLYLYAEKCISYIMRVRHRAPTLAPLYT